MTQREPIKVSGDTTRERKRRQRELWLAMGGAVLIVLLTWVELQYIGLDSYLFLGLFNFNFILLAVILFVVIRNMVKLVLERRRKVLGSRLRTRLVLAFMSLSLIPTLIMFFISVQFVQTGIDYWFQTQVESSMDKALEVGQTAYSLARKRPERVGNSMVWDIRERRFAWGGKGMDSYIAEKKKQFDLGIAGVLTPELDQQNWHMDEDFQAAWQEFRSKTDWASLREEPRYHSMIVPGVGMDVVVGALPVDQAKTGFLVLGESLGQGLLFKMDRIVRGVEEYKKLQNLKAPLKVALYLTMGLMTFSIILGSIWFGFRLAKELSQPVQALAMGTQRIARGDLGVRLEDKSSDELGFLVQSFNRMAEDLQESQERLKQANQRLGSQNQELEARGSYIEALLDNITAGVVSLDSRGRVNTVNKAAETMLGLDASDIIGRTPVELLEGEYRERVEEVLAQLEKSPGQQWQQQVNVGLGSREAKFLVNVVGLRTPEGRDAGLVAVFEDITELEKMQRVAAWREVARRIAHEIKNPLTPIKLSAQRLERRFAGEVEDPVFTESTRLIVRQVENMQQMVQEFSAFAKMPEVVLKPDDLPSLVSEVVDLFRHSHASIDWELSLHGEFPQVRFDREGVRRVLINILTNAAEAMGEVRDSRVEVDCSYDSILKLAVVEVRDNGPGLSDEDRTRLFEPYFSRKKGGTGLGLTIARSIVSDHHGYLRVRPNHPRGTIFVVELPLQG